MLGLILLVGTLLGGFTTAWWIGRRNPQLQDALAELVARARAAACQWQLAGSLA